ncbi:OLC1v1010889C1 [Oldenlandia corymbosa var. corymbosa]|uniref:OLC1v1010889C1 n=1 Tax=Oldenlandia corymbosa var. corymbosa TaxID=529605 RepID=A0AAV1DSH4_OLDCO|nr:OLC1v1010889C1 [Oldenlandia corymbosa var. corymbosa]
MEASVRILLNSSARQFTPCFHPLKIAPILSSPNYRPRSAPLPPASLLHRQNHHPIICSNAYVPHHGSQASIPFGFSNPVSISGFNLDKIIFSSNFSRFFSDPKQKSFEWNYAQNGIHGRENGIIGEKGPIVTAVLLGWLGAKPKHLRKYVELYNSRGIHAITFVASINDVLSFDLGKKLEDRISGLTHELTSWLSESEKDGRERFLIFHTFSNTGWLGYGAILDNLLNKPNLLEKVKGCVVDSGGDPNIDPKVWAAGFTAALLKKYSSSAYPSVEQGDLNALEKGMDTSKIGKPLLIETMLLSALEKFFSYILNLREVNQKLAKIVATLSNNQPSCPLLYLYSAADKVIPYQAVESFIELQRRSGRDVRSFNFGTSPHVDHYRTFPSLYTSEIEKFLNDCLLMAKNFKMKQ